MREGKGTSIQNYIRDYCVVDLETTGINVTSAEIIEISAIKVRDGEVIEEYSTLVNPEIHIPRTATAVNGITDDMVKDAPVLENIIDDFLQFVGEDVIVGYNNAAFDICIIYDDVLNLTGRIFKNNYIDVLHAVRRSITNIENNKLETVSKYYGFDTTGEHRALKDCYLTNDCYKKLYEEFGDNAFKGKAHSKGTNPKQYSIESQNLRVLQNFLEEIVSSGDIRENDLITLRNWIEEHRDLQDKYPFSQIFSLLDETMKNEKITANSLLELQELFLECIDPVKHTKKHNEILTLFEKHVCVTGEFDYGSRKEVASLVEEFGGIIDKTVKKATNYVVVGSNGSDNWKTGKYGAKIQKTMQYNSKGANIEIVEEKDFIRAIQHMDKNVSEYNEREY